MPLYCFPGSAAALLESVGLEELRPRSAAEQPSMPKRWCLRRNCTKVDHKGPVGPRSWSRLPHTSCSHMTKRTGKTERSWPCTSSSCCMVHTKHTCCTATHRSHSWNTSHKLNTRERSLLHSLVRSSLRKMVHSPLRTLSARPPHMRSASPTIACGHGRGIGRDTIRPSSTYCTRWGRSSSNRRPSNSSCKRARRPLCMSGHSSWSSMSVGNTRSSRRNMRLHCRQRSSTSLAPSPLRIDFVYSLS